MKVRNGFVSNSSSSSFLIVGLERGWKEENENFTKITKQDGLHEGMENPDYQPNYGVDDCLSDVINYYGSWEEHMPYMLGVEIEDDLYRGKTLQEIKDDFRKLIKEHYDVDLNKDEVKLIYGEVGSG